MKKLISIIIVGIWYLIGVSGFIYWWCSDHVLLWDKTLPLVLNILIIATMLVSGSMGPISWIWGCIIHG